MLSLKEMMTLMGIVTADPSLPMEKPKLVGVSPIQATCLAENVYFEARNQGTAGWSAVISVTLNRVKDKRFPNTVCEVVKQGPTRESWKKNGIYYPIRHRCQFSWYCDGKADQPLESNAWEEAYLLSIHVINMYDVISDPTKGSIMYHAVNVKPYWTSAYRHKVTIGDHIFYGSLK